MTPFSSAAGLVVALLCCASIACSSGSDGAADATGTGGAIATGGGAGGAAGRIGTGGGAAGARGTGGFGNTGGVASGGVGGALGGAAGGPDGMPDRGGAGGNASATGGHAGAAGARGAGGSSGAAGSNAGGGGGGGGAAFDPCPTASGSVCAIMPLGDSITEGFRSSDYGGYREPLFKLAQAAKKSITFVGSAPPRGPSTVNGVPFPTANEGVGGRRISDIVALIPSTLNTNKPHIILLHIGTNNFSDGVSSMTSQLAALVDKILAAAPSSLLVLAQIIPTKTDATNVTVKAYDDSMPAMVKARADAGKHIVLVDMYSAFMSNPNYKTAWMSDDYHPRDAGYSEMASVWYPAIEAYLR